MARASILFHVLLCVCLFQSKAQSTLKNDSVFSPTLHKYVLYTILYIEEPSVHHQSGYRTLYLLHGLNGNETDWAKNGHLQNTVDSLFNAGKIAPMAIVMPDAGNSYYVNNDKRTCDYESMFFDEFMPMVSEKNGLTNDRGKLAIAGLSMGGFGAVSYCLRYPNVFSVCGAISGALRTEEQYNNLNEEYFNSVFKPVFGDTTKIGAKATQHWKNVDPLHLVETTDITTIQNIKWYIDCGNQDPFARGNTLFHTFLLKNNIVHEFHLREGKHDWDYWKKNIIPTLLYVDKNLK